MLQRTKTERLDDADLAWLGMLPPPALDDIVHPRGERGIKFLLARHERILERRDDFVTKVCMWFVDATDAEPTALPRD